MTVVRVSEFTKKVLQLIQAIPEGRVATYKQIAELAGKPQGSRGVSWILHSSSVTYNLPWHRVINSQGKISFDPASSNYREQKRKLKREGIVFSDEDKLSLPKYQWQKKARARSRKSGAPKMFQS
jgi:methylated-DNA-protein-cysteine methyltransferase-like protein